MQAGHLCVKIGHHRLYFRCMAVKIIIGANEDETRMGLIEDGRLAEYLVERRDGRHLVGSIFKGRVANVVRGIQAAFIDIGLEQNAFMYLGGAERVTEGESLLVQITKDARGGKGPTAVRELALAGRYLVLLPRAGYVGISKKITDKAERSRLAALGTELLPEGMGLVMRTAAQGVGRELLERDIRTLVASFSVMEARDRSAKAPCLLYRELDLPVRIVRDYLSPELDEIILDNASVLSRIKELKDRFPEAGGVKLTLHKGPEDIFTFFGLAGAIAAISDRKVELKSGGYLVIDHTEAMTVIDVNSGRFSGRESLEETVVAINREAASEIARQVRLRDIGGIIVVDFIDMSLKEHRQEIVRELERAMAGDRQRPKVQDITVLNLVEITRRKSRQNLSGVLYTECPVCRGSGRVKSRETLSLEIKSRLRAALGKGGSSRSLVLTLNPWLAAWLEARQLKGWERELNCSLSIARDPSLNPESFMLLEDNGVDKCGRLG